MTEQVFFAEGNVQVSRSRIVIDNQTYPISGVTSVRTETLAVDRQQSFICIFAGIVIPFGLWEFVGIIALLLGIAVLVVGVWLWQQAKPKYQLFVGTAGGDRLALSSHDESFVQRVAGAINNALIARG
jgi:predicted small integral membrane protein